MDSYHTPTTPVALQLTPMLEEDLQQLPVWSLSKMVGVIRYEAILNASDTMFFHSSQWTPTGLHHLSHLPHPHPLLVSSSSLTTEWSHHQLCPHLHLWRQNYQQHQNQQHQSDHHRSGAIHQLHLFCECLNSCGRWSCCSEECGH